MENQKALIDFLRNNRLMVLCTSDDNIPWATTVYYVVDENNFIYFMSAKDSKHVLDIEKNNKVAIAIAGTNQEFYSEKIGAQIAGIAQKLEPESEEYKKGLELLLTTVWGYNEEKLLQLDTVKSMTGLVFKIKMDYVMFLNENLFGEHVSQKLVF